MEEAKRTGFRYVRLSKYLFRQYGIEISQNTIRAILKRNEVKPKKVRTKSKGTRHLYNYEELEAFEELQIDTKYLHDSNSLPEDVYENMRGSSIDILNTYLAKAWALEIDPETALKQANKEIYDFLKSKGYYK